MVSARGVARNLLRGGGGQKRMSGDGRPQAGPRAEPEYSAEQSRRSSQIAYCLKSDYTLKKKIPATSGGTCTHAPIDYVTAFCTLYWRVVNVIDRLVNCRNVPIIC